MRPSGDAAGYLGYIAAIGLVTGLSPFFVLSAGIATGAAGVATVVVMSLLALAVCCAICGAREVGRAASFAALWGGGALFSVPFALLEHPRSPAPAAAPPLYSLATLPFVLIPLLAGSVGILIGLRIAARAAAAEDESRCARCGYPLDPSSSTPCPECGLTREEGKSRRGADVQDRRTEPAIGIALLVLGGLLLGFTAPKAVQQVRAQSYPSVVADSSEVFGVIEGSGRSARPVISAWYSYTVAGTLYTGERYSYSQFRIFGPELERPVFFTLGAAQHFAARVNDRGPLVYYNPANPADSTLTVGLDGAVLFRLSIGLALVAKALALVMPLALGPVLHDWGARARAVRAALLRLATLAAGSAGVVVLLLDGLRLSVGGIVGLMLLVVSLAGATWAYLRTS